MELLKQTDLMNIIDYEKVREKYRKDIINYKKSGEPFLCRLVMLPFRNSKGKTLYLGLQNDITNKNFNIMNDKLKLVQSSEICHILNNQIAVLLFKIESMDINLLEDITIITFFCLITNFITPLIISLSSIS